MRLQPPGSLEGRRPLAKTRSPPKSTKLWACHAGLRQKTSAGNGEGYPLHPGDRTLDPHHQHIGYCRFPKIESLPLEGNGGCCWLNNSRFIVQQIGRIVYARLAPLNPRRSQNSRQKMTKDQVLVLVLIGQFINSGSQGQTAFVPSRKISRSSPSEILMTLQLG